MYSYDSKKKSFYILSQILKINYKLFVNPLIEQINSLLYCNLPFFEIEGVHFKTYNCYVIIAQETHLPDNAAYNIQTPFVLNKY